VIQGLSVAMHIRIHNHFSIFFLVLAIGPLSATFFHWRKPIVVPHLLVANIRKRKRFDNKPIAFYAVPTHYFRTYTAPKNVVAAGKGTASRAAKLMMLVSKY